MPLSVDFHTHTIASKDSLTTPERIVDILRRGRLNRIVVTDHDTITGAMAAYALDPEHVIVGEEIMTTRGEILAAYVTEEIPPGLSPQETIRRLRDQGAFISVSHPLDRLRSGAWKLEDLLEIAPLVDAIETFNARCMFAADNARAGEFAQGQEELRKVIGQGQVRGRLSPPWVHFASRYASLRKKLRF
jgi:predicted metal-dependent phosphoesterase TrpH